MKEAAEESARLAPGMHLSNPELVFHAFKASLLGVQVLLRTLFRHLDLSFTPNCTILYIYAEESKRSLVYLNHVGVLDPLLQSEKAWGEASGGPCTRTSSENLESCGRPARSC